MLYIYTCNYIRVEFMVISKLEGHGHLGLVWCKEMRCSFFRLQSMVGNSESTFWNFYSSLWNENNRAEWYYPPKHTIFYFLGNVSLDKPYDQIQDAPFITCILEYHLPPAFPALTI